MSSIPGPIISFRISSDLSGAIRPALDQIKREAKSASQQIADDWKRMAAQIRATTALGSGTEQQIAASRKELVSILDKEISGLRTRNELSKQELANLKAQTLERERQVSALKGTGGLTAGTSSALNQVSTQTVLGITRALDSFVNRFFGGAAGALFRTARDVGYYSNQATGGAAAGGGVFSGIGSGFNSILGSLSPATLAAGSFAAGIAVTGTILSTVTHSMIEYAQAVQNVSAATGLSYSETQKFREIAKLTGLDTDTLTTSFGRLQAELGKFIVSGKDSEGSTQNFVKVLDKFGVSVTDANGKLRPIGQTMNDFFSVLGEIPDAETRTAVGMDAMGVRGKVIVQVFENLRAQGLTLKQALDEVTKATLDDSKIRELLQEKKSWDDLVLSIDAAKIHLEAFIATHRTGVLGGIINLPGEIGIAGAQRLNSFFSVPGAPQPGQFPTVQGAPGFSNPTVANAQAILAAAAARQNAGFLNEAEITKAGGKAQADLLEADKKYNDAVKEGHGEQALALAKQIESLKSIIELEKSRAAINERIYRLVSEGKLSGNARSVPDSVDTIINRFLQYGTTNKGAIPINPPDNGLLSSPFGVGGGLGTGFPNYLAGIVPQGGPTKGAPDLLKQISDEHDDLFKTQREKDIEHYADELRDLNDALHDQLISQQQYSEALTKLQQDRNKTLADADKKYEDEASKLFDDLLSGKGKAFGKSFQKDIINIVTQPIRDIFDQFIGGIFGNLSRAVQGPFGGSTGISGIGSKLGGIFGGLGGLGTSGGRIGPGGTAGWWPGQVGGGISGASGAPSVGVSAGQVGVATPVMNVHADIVNISGSLALPGQGPLGSATGNFFGNLNPFASSAISGPIGLAGIGGIGSSGGLGGVLSSLGPAIGSGALIGAGIASNNPTAMALGAATLAQSGIKALTQFGGPISSNSGLGQALGTVAPALPGIGLFAGGVAQGGVGGTLEATAGGAMAGLALGGPIGAAIGAGVGLISGVVSTLIQGPSFAQRVQRHMNDQAYRLPPSETFSFAMGNSIAQTLSTGFNQSGSNFGTYGLSNVPFFANPIKGPLSKEQQHILLQEQEGLLPNQPFLGFPGTDPFVGQGPVGRKRGSGTPNVHFNITAIDSKGVADFITEHGSNIARMLNSTTPYSSSSGFGSAARRVTALP